MPPANATRGRYKRNMEQAERRLPRERIGAIDGEAGVEETPGE